jgi:hypothetical protein
MIPIRECCGLLMLTIVTTAMARSPTRYQPIILLDAGATRIEACGVKAEREIDENRVRVDLRQVRTDGGPKIVFTVEWHDPAGRSVVLDAAELRTPSASSAGFTAQPFEQGFRAIGRLPGAAGGQLFQELLLGRSELMLTTAAGAVHEITLPWPAALDVNKSYLNCAGDMYRQLQ